MANSRGCVGHARMALSTGLVAALIAWVGAPVAAQRYTAPDGTLRVALTKQPLSPNGPSKGPTTMAEGGIQRQLAQPAPQVSTACVFAPARPASWTNSRTDSATSTNRPGI